MWHYFIGWYETKVLHKIDSNLNSMNTYYLFILRERERERERDGGTFVKQMIEA